MKLLVNGEDVEFDQQTLQELIQQLNLDGKVMAAAVNMQIVKQDKWSLHHLQEDDKIELLDFVGGG
jgi:sulfur carrier protein